MIPQNIDLLEYGPVPRHLVALGMTQQMWYDWMDGGNTCELADEIANRYLEQKYGKDKAQKICDLYSFDGTNRYVDIVAGEYEPQL